MGKQRTAIVRLMTAKAHLDAMEKKMLPDTQYQALANLAVGYTPEEVWAEISADKANLAGLLQTQFELLSESEDVRRQVEILNNVGKVVHQARGTVPEILLDLTDPWEVAAERAGLSFAPTFLNREWEQVILA